MSIKSAIFNLLPGRIKQNINNRITRRLLEKKFIESYIKFNQTNYTGQEDYLHMIDLYCVTNGSFNEEFNNKLKLKKPSIKINSDLAGVGGEYTLNEFNTFNEQLNENGYAPFKKKLDKELCDNLYKFALQTPGKTPVKSEKILYDPETPIAEIYRFDIQDLINNKNIQRLIIDPIFVNAARNYLGCEPIFDFPAMWWSTSLKKEASDEAAQLYHFDMDRIKWLKIFIYVNDVTLENGPHNYIRGSHKPGSKPEDILKRGYKRIPDEDLYRYYKSDDIKTICGEAGSIFAGDTKCWHKGTPLKKGHRLVLELEYTSSLFGANYPKMIVTDPGKEFKEFCQANRHFASHIEFKNQL